MLTPIGEVKISPGDTVIYRGAVRWRMCNKWRVGRHTGRRLKRRARRWAHIRRWQEAMAQMLAPQMTALDKAFCSLFESLVRQCAH